MFLRQRCLQAEYFDADRPEAELREFFAALDRVNRFARYAEPFEQHLPSVLNNACQSASILEIGSGNGALSRHLSEWARRQGWNWSLTELDTNPAALGLSVGPRQVVGTALALPFPDGSFDAVIASQMTHHLSENEAVQHLRQAWRVARRGIVVVDLRRSTWFYAALWLATLRGYPKTFRQDALLSVKKAWTGAEFTALALQANIPAARVQGQYGTRLVLVASKNH